jgi:hypothetical protein
MFVKGMTFLFVKKSSITWYSRTFVAVAKPNPKYLLQEDYSQFQNALTVKKLALKRKDQKVQILFFIFNEQLQHMYLKPENLLV